VLVHLVKLFSYMIYSTTFFLLTLYILYTFSCMVLRRVLQTEVHVKLIHLFLLYDMHMYTTFQKCGFLIF